MPTFDKKAREESDQAWVGVDLLLRAGKTYEELMEKLKYKHVGSLHNAHTRRGPLAKWRRDAIRELVREGKTPAPVTTAPRFDVLWEQAGIQGKRFVTILGQAIEATPGFLVTKEVQAWLETAKEIVNQMVLAHGKETDAEE